MDRRNICNNINSNTSNIYNHIKRRVVRNNLVNPEIFVSEIWMQDNAKNGVEIIELNSSNSEAIEETSQEPSNNYSQAWSFVNHDRFRNVEEDYRINKIAREKWRKKNEEEFSIACANEYLHDHDTQVNLNGFHYVDDSEITGIPHEQMNCFTIINNHVVNSDSSSENEYVTVEEIEPYYAENNNDFKYWDHVYKDNTMSCGNAEKRTVWIYSHKNKRFLPENDFELVNILSKDSSDSSSSPTSDEERRSANVCRIASPIPATFIPRLDLSLAQTLSTVTEISEIKISEESLIIKPVNNWLTERNNEKSKKDVSNVINWMALSPRERRRRFKNTKSDSIYENHERKDFFTHAEGNTKCEWTTEPLRKPLSSVIKVDVEVHASNAPAIIPDNDVEIVSVDSFDSEPKADNKEVANMLPINISYADADTAIDDGEGDCNFESSNIKFKIPCIKLTSDKTYDIITEPIEKLNNCEWIIGAEKNEEQTGEFDYVLNLNEDEDKDSTSSADTNDSTSKRLWKKNAMFMKSPQWTEYLPITETLQSLHLSLSLSSIESKKSWLKRMGKYFKCCK